MKKCKNCGCELPEEAMFCTLCGKPVEENFEGTTVLFENSFDEGTTVLEPENNFEGENYYNPPQTTPNQAYQSPEQPKIHQNTHVPQQPVDQISLEQFFDKFSSKKTKNLHKTVAFICIITAVLSIAMLGMGNYISVIDVIFYLVFGILLFKKKNWAIPLVVTCYGGLFSIIDIASTGAPSGIFACVVGIMATIRAKKVNDAYKNYRSTGQFPKGLI